MKMYDLLEKENRRLGDKTEYFYELQQNVNGNNGKITDSIQEVLDREGLNAREILADPGKFDKYEYIRRQVGLTASQKQEDVLLFIEEILQIIRVDWIRSNFHFWG